MDDRVYNNAVWAECLILLRLLTMHRKHRFLMMLRSEKHTTSNCENNFHFERLRLKLKTLLSYSWKKMSTCAFSSLWRHHRQPWRPALHTHTLENTHARSFHGQWALLSPFIHMLLSSFSCLSRGSWRTISAMNERNNKAFVNQTVPLENPLTSSPGVLHWVVWWMSFSQNVITLAQVCQSCNSIYICIFREEKSKKLSMWWHFLMSASVWLV